ncbi:hypothetical protein HN954_01655 [bacterium]|jgi:drug/metabolite transporter (DMT)-like permease|nr:hypothetical protein [bacterium]MBT6831974.1 hypothetical protein [bacterium]MBT6996115.1 hypothetical protein [bacterium]MBT7772650.1 hypothetical protein [bacterium]
MFFFLAVISMAAYAVQNTLLVHHVRKLDGLSVAIFRNFSLIVTMSPLLFLATRAEIFAVFQNWPLLLAASATGAISLTFSLWSIKFLPVGISLAFRRGLGAILMFVAGFLMFGETISLIEAGIVLLVILTTTWVTLIKNNFEHLNHRVRIGFLLAIICTIFGVITFSLMSLLAREAGPAATGYFWEMGIGICALMIGFGRQIFGGKKIAKISGKVFLKIALISWPTLIATGSFAYAVTLGPIGIANAIGTGGILVGTVMAHFLYREKLKKMQWILIFAIAAEIAIFKLLGY